MPARACRSPWAPTCSRRRSWRSRTAIPITCSASPGLIAARRFGKGATDKPLTIVFPEGSARRPGGARMARARLRRRRLPSQLDRRHAGHRASRSARTSSSKRSPFATPPNEPALGYRVVETRKRLKPEFASLPQAEIEAAARQGTRDDLLEDVAPRACSRIRAMRCRSIRRSSPTPTCSSTTRRS